MSETIGERDEGFLLELQSAGYTAETIVLAELMPQIQIAWADGRVSKRERDVILETAAHRGVPPHSCASLQLARWLEHQPSAGLFRISLHAIKRMLRRLPTHVQTNVRRSLFQEYAAIAGASGGFLGWGSVSANERQVMDSLGEELDRHQAPETWVQMTEDARRAVQRQGRLGPNATNGQRTN